MRESKQAKVKSQMAIICHTRWFFDPILISSIFYLPKRIKLFGVLKNYTNNFDLYISFKK